MLGPALTFKSEVVTLPNGGEGVGVSVGNGVSVGTAKGWAVAVLAIDAYTTLGVYEAWHELGLRIPDDVSVIGFDDSEIAHIVKPPTTIIAQRADEIGHAAVELLERRISTKFDTNGSRKTCTHVTIDVDLIERQSVSLLTRD